MSNKPWRLEFVLLFCVAQFVCLSVALLAVEVLHRLAVAGFRGDEDFGVVVVGTMGLQGATWVLIPFFLRRHQVDWKDAFGLHRENLGRALGLALATLVVALPVTLALKALSAWVIAKFHHHVDEQAAVQILSGSDFWPTGAYMSFFAVVLAPVAEEFIFRGMLYPIIKQAGFPKLAWLLTGSLFALSHGAIVTFVPLFVLALALTWLYEKTDKLVMTIAVHSLFNATNLVLFYVVGLQ